MCTSHLSLPPNAKLLKSSASSSKSPDALFAALNASGLPDNAASREFIHEVFRRVPRKSKHKSSRDSANKQAEKAAASLQSQKYSFVLEDDAPPDAALDVDKARRKSGKDKRERHGRKREAAEGQWEDDEEEQARKRRKGEEEGSRQRAGDGDEDMEAGEVEDEDERRERQRLEDLKERDAFAERMRDRDKEKTKKVIEDRSSKTSGEAADAARRRQLADDSEARSVALPSLREHSRQEYLKKRELQRVELLRQEIADEESLFRGMKVTKKEQANLDRRKQLLRLIEERLKLEDHYDGYQLPEDYITEQGKIDKKKKESVLYKRYEEGKVKDDQFVTDIDQWEASQTRHSTFKTGAMDKPELVDDYEYVFDESQTIQFVMDRALGGENMMSAKDKLLQAQIDEAEKRGEYYTG